MLLELVGEQVAIGSGILVEQQHLGAKHHLGGLGFRLAVAHDIIHRQLSVQAFHNHRADIAAAIATVIDDEGLLVELRIEILGKLIQSFHTHVGDVDVTHLSVGGLAHFLHIALHPVVVIQACLISDRFHHHIAGTTLRCLVI